MRRFIAVIMLLCLSFGCRKARPPLVIGDATPIVDAGRTTESVGVEMPDGTFRPLIRSGIVVPVSYSEAYSSSGNGQSSYGLTIFCGTNDLAVENRPLGQFQILGISSAPRDRPQLKITFTVSENQILLSARDLVRKADLEIQRTDGESNRTDQLPQEQTGSH